MNRSMLLVLLVVTAELLHDSVGTLQVQTKLDGETSGGDQIFLGIEAAVSCNGSLC